MQKTRFYQSLSLIVCIVLIAAMALFTTGCTDNNPVSTPSTSSAPQAEIKALAAFLPAEMSEEEVLPILEAVIAELGATTKKDMGRVMKEMQARTAGAAPGKLLSKLVGARLA